MRNPNFANSCHIALSIFRKSGFEFWVERCVKKRIVGKVKIVSKVSKICFMTRLKLTTVPKREKIVIAHRDVLICLECAIRF